jgi:nitrile hydratase
VPVGADQPWSAAWQPLAYTLASMTARIAGVNGDALRHVMERLPAEKYRQADSAGRWLQVAERCAVEGGLVAEGEVLDRARRREARQPPRPVEDYPEPSRSTPEPPNRRSPPHNKRVPGDDDRPAFAAGHRVLVAQRARTGHTRLPAYLLGHRGEVVVVNGYWLLPDAHADDGTETPTWVYAVRFEASDLWAGAGPHDVIADLFEPYLLPDPRSPTEVPGA